MFNIIINIINIIIFIIINIIEKTILLLLEKKHIFDLKDKIKNCCCCCCCYLGPVKMPDQSNLVLRSSKLLESGC
jgi:hypothetical protein